ncbi:hypothetical protein D3C78_483890 [compost metagenome]
MGLLHFQLVAALGLPVLGEGRVVGLVQLASGVVGNVEQLRGGGYRAGDQGGNQGSGQCGQGETTNGHVQLLKNRLFCVGCFVWRYQPRIAVCGRQLQYRRELMGDSAITMTLR